MSRCRDGTLIGVDVLAVKREEVLSAVHHHCSCQSLVRSWIFFEGNDTELVSCYSLSESGSFGSVAVEYIEHVTSITKSALTNPGHLLAGEIVH